MNPLLRCHNLVWHSGERPILSRLDLDLRAGESLALLGGSGSGKSTLLRIIAGLEIPDAGDVFLGGRLVTQGDRLVVAPHRREVAMLFQDLALWPNLTVTGNVALGLAGVRLSRAMAHTRVLAMLKRCKIENLADRRPGTLSGGQQQRVALARALAMQPRLLLLDEPFGGLDLVTRESVIHEVRELKREFGFALILVTHDPADVEVLCDSLAVLETGRIGDRDGIKEFPIIARSTLGQAFARRLGPAPGINAGRNNPTPEDTPGDSAVKGD